MDLEILCWQQKFCTGNEVLVGLRQWNLVTIYICIYIHWISLQQTKKKRLLHPNLSCVTSTKCMYRAWGKHMIPWVVNASAPCVVLWVTRRSLQPAGRRRRSRCSARRSASRARQPREPYSKYCTVITCEPATRVPHFVRLLCFLSHQTLWAPPTQIIWSTSIFGCCLTTLYIVICRLQQLGITKSFSW